jgi:hypothetical protein
MAAPPPVEGFTVLARTYDTVLLGWDLYDPNNTVDVFRLYVGLEPGDRTNFTSIANNIASFNVTRYPFGPNSRLVPGFSYYFTIVGRKGALLSNETQQFTSTIPMEAPPNFNTGLVTANSIENTWDEYPNDSRITRLNLYWGITPNPSTVIAINKNLLSYTLGLPTENIISNTLYYLSLTAIILQNDPLPDFESPRAELIIVTPALPPVSVDVINTTAFSITIEWVNPVQSPTYIKLAISLEPDNYTNSVTLDPAETTYEFTGLTPETYYYFRVVNVNMEQVETSGVFTLGATSKNPLPINPGNYLMYIYKATNGFKNSPNSPQRSSRRPVIRQIR